MCTKRPRSDRSYWVAKFLASFRGIVLGIHGQKSFLIHISFAIAAIVLGAILRVSNLEWCLLALCLAGVLGAEMFNSALEWLAKAITQEENPYVGGALDIGSAAVLLAAIGAAVVGAVIFVRHFAALPAVHAWWAG